MLPSDVNPEREMRQRYLKREADLREAKKVRIQGERYTLGIVSGVINRQTEVAAIAAFLKSKPHHRNEANSFRIIDDARLSAMVEIGGVKNEGEAIKMTRKLLASVGITESVEVGSLDEATINRSVTISFRNVGKRVEAMKAAVAQGWTTEKEINSFSFRDVRFTAKGSKPLGKLATLMKKFGGFVSNSQLPHGGITGQGGSTRVDPT